MKRRQLRFGEGFRVIPGNRHSQAANTGRALLRTLNVYVPPAYGRKGDPLPRGRK